MSFQFDQRLCRTVTDPELREQLLLLTCLLNRTRCESTKPSDIWSIWVDMCNKGLPGIDRQIKMNEIETQNLLTCVLLGQRRAEQWFGRWPDKTVLEKLQSDLWLRYGQQLDLTWKDNIKD